MNGLNNIPKPLLVFAVFLIGILLIVYNNRPHSICDTQLEDFQEAEKGYLYPMPVKDKGTRAPIHDRALSACLDGQGSAGACLEYTKILQKMLVDLDPLAPSCGEFMTPTGVVRRTLGEGMKVLVQIAWGEELPAKGALVPGASVTGRLDATEVSLFCNLRNTWLKYFDKESYENLKTLVVGELPAKQYEVNADGLRVCKNCTVPPPKVFEVMGSREEAIKHSLFSVNCAGFR